MIKISYDRIKKCAGFKKWLFYWYWGVTKWGDREWAFRIFGLTFINELDGS